LLQVAFDSQHINKTKCNCPIELVGCCGHITGMLYQIANYKTLGLRALPKDVAKTSLPQTWHQLREATIRGNAVQEVSVTGYSKTKNAVKEQPTIIETTLYNPVKGQPPEWCFGHQLLQPVAPDMLVLPCLATKSADVVLTKFGPVPLGSVLIYQQKLDDNLVINIMEGVAFPNLPVQNFIINTF